MDEKDREKIKKLITDRKRAHSFYSEKSKVYRKFIELEEEAYSEGILGKKYKELIAIGISVILDCESCMEWHINEALKSGADNKQIIEAIEVAMEMGGGPASVSARFAMKVLEYYE
jgi:AhpD family alkylhydroperoxidase